MYLKKVKSIKNRLTFKLTFLYIVLFYYFLKSSLVDFFSTRILNYIESNRCGAVGGDQ
jgi:hypothetical protein